MIRSVAIQDFRGIHEGSLGGLTPLVVLVGKNGAGKSTVLEALHLALTSGNPHEIAHRRDAVPDSLRWLRYGGAAGSSIVTFTLDGVESPVRYQFKLLENLTGHSSGYASAPPAEMPSARFVEPRHKGSHQALVQLYSDVVRQGRKRDVLSIISSVIDGFEDLQILTTTESPPRPVLHVGYGNRSVPVAYAGDGVFSLIITTLELVSEPGGIVLIEEPEVHQYPATLRQVAAVIAESVARGVQVILSTHSLELIDALVGAMTERKMPERLQLIRLALDDGVLKSSAISGGDVAFARTQIDDDLR